MVVFSSQMRSKTDELAFFRESICVDKSEEITAGERFMGANIHIIIAKFTL